MAKRFTSGPAPPRFPSLRGGRNLPTNEQGPIGPFFPPKVAFSPPPRLRPDLGAPPLTAKGIASKRAKSCSLSAPGLGGIPYLTWKSVNAINPSILQQSLFPLVSLAYHPASLKVANGVVLDKPGKPS